LRRAGNEGHLAGKIDGQIAGWRVGHDFGFRERGTIAEARLCGKMARSSRPAPG
jgi:hypothetical protein